MAFTPIENTVTLSASEKSITNNSTTIATNSTVACVQLFIDVSAMATGNETLIKVYEKVLSAGTQRVIQQWTLTGIQSNPIWVSPTFLLAYGWDWTLTGVSGTPAIPSSIRPIAVV